MKKCSWLLVLCLVAAACSSEEARDDGSCAADSDCQAPTAACDLGASNTCVQCVPGRKTEACVGTSPVCDASLRCQPCTRHADCLSDACMPDGSCAAESNVLYLREGGMGTVCSKAMPCGSFEAALAALSNTQTILRVSGLISNSEGFIAFGSAVLLGDSAGAALRGGGTGAAAPILSLVNGARVEVYDVAFRDSRDAAVSISASSQATLVRSRIDNSAGEGILVAGKARLRQSEVTSCNDPGRPAISVLPGGELTVDRSRISDNDSTGVVVADGGRGGLRQPERVRPPQHPLSKHRRSRRHRAAARPLCLHGQPGAGGRPRRHHPAVPFGGHLAEGLPPDGAEPGLGPERRRGDLHRLAGLRR